MVIYYLDTSILIDFFENRGRNGDNAKKLVLKIIDDDLSIIFSDVHIQELKLLGYTMNELVSLLNAFKPSKIVRVHIDKKQYYEAASLALSLGVPKRDVLHTVLARDNNAIMVTNDKHFEKLRGLVEVKGYNNLF